MSKLYKQLDMLASVFLKDKSILLFKLIFLLDSFILFKLDIPSFMLFKFSEQDFNLLSEILLLFNLLIILLL